MLVLGLGRFGGGVGVTRWLVSQGAVVTVTDQAAGEQLADSVEAIADLQVTLHLGGHDDADLDSTDLVVVNPAVNKRVSSFFGTIVQRRIDRTTEINLFCERCPATVVGVTGTYGKSTTCAMLADVLRAYRRRGLGEYREVYLGGNIGGSLLGELSRMTPDDLVVCELSAAQLEDLPLIDWVPHIAVITNLFPHHLDRYGTMEAYVAAKLNIAGSSNYAGSLIVGEGGDAMKRAMARIAQRGSARVHRAEVVGRPIDLRVWGEHNQSNAACAITVCRVLGVDEIFAREVLRSSEGLPHRLQLIRTVNGVDFVNDAKSTSPAATVNGVIALSRPAIVIVGGQLKDVSLTDWAGTLAQRVRATICIGDAGSLFARAMRAATEFVEPIDVREAASLGDALRLAVEVAEAGDVVLFSPGAPSFDAYPNFAARGRHFIELVNAL